VSQVATSSWLLFKTISDMTQFGASRTPPVQPPDDSDSEDEQDIEDTQAFPRVEEWRMNLTVLSQYYNVRQMCQIYGHTTDLS
jgi:hypothetical protein